MKRRKKEEESYNNTLSQCFNRKIYHNNVTRKH